MNKLLTLFVKKANIALSFLKKYLVFNLKIDGEPYIKKSRLAKCTYSLRSEDL